MMFEARQQMTHGGGFGGSDLAFTDSLQGQIGIQLRGVFESMVTDNVPSRFVELLNHLDSRMSN